MNETSKSSALPQRARLYEKYLLGRGLDIGCGNDILKLEGREIDGFDLPQGDAQYLMGKEDASYDFVHSSHCLEHVRDVPVTLWNWARVVKPGGAVFITVPEWTFYERRIWPSAFNGDHKQRFSIMPVDDPAIYTTGDMARIGREVKLELCEVFLELDKYDFAQLASRFIVDQTLADAQAQVCYVFRKALP